MANAERVLNVAVEMSAAVATFRVPAALLLEFGAGDKFEVATSENGPTVELFLNGKLFAIASLARREGRLIATITEIRKSSD
jgi:flagellar motor switch/type III secretory pathway protein FliN